MSGASVRMRGKRKICVENVEALLSSDSFQLNGQDSEDIGTLLWRLESLALDPSSSISFVKERTEDGKVSASICFSSIDFKSDSFKKKRVVDGEKCTAVAIASDSQRDLFSGSFVKDLLDCLDQNFQANEDDFKADAENSFKPSNQPLSCGIPFPETWSSPEEESSTHCPIIAYRREWKLGVSQILDTLKTKMRNEKLNLESKQNAQKSKALIVYNHTPDEFSKNTH